ncbi:MAG: glycosyltransferase [Pseudomonadota bacterium]
MDKIAILLATYNGDQYLEEQLESICAQTHMAWHLFARDDGSTDATVGILKLYAARYSNITIVDNDGEFTGSATGNFFKLLHFSDFQGFSHISFSDQDDVWAPSKLKAALTCMSLNNASAYSSNLVSYDNDMMRANYIDKSQHQKEFDYIFQGASAGCTYVFTRAVCLLVQQKTAGVNEYKGRSHDWLIYALCRVNDVCWVFDREAHIFYRQHARNVYGSMSALSGMVARLKMLRSGWYRDNIIWVAEMSGATLKAGSVLERIKRNSLTDKVGLLKMVARFRRSKRESWLLALIILFLF